MDTHIFQYFVSVANTLSFTMAARENYVSQPAISKQISELEDYLGCKLFTRTKHTVKLTVAGVEFLRYANDFLEMESDMMNHFNYLANNQYGQLKISMVDSSRDQVIECITRMNQVAPLIQLDIELSPGWKVRANFSDPAYDFFFASEASILTSTGFSYLRTLPSHMCLVYPKAWASEINVNDFSTLQNRPFAFIGRDIGYVLYDLVLEICRSRGYRPIIMSYHKSAEAILLSIEAGICFSIIPEETARAGNPERISYVRIPGENTSLLGAVAWRTGRDNSLGRNFLEILQQIYGGEIYHT